MSDQLPLVLSFTRMNRVSASAAIWLLGMVKAKVPSGKGFAKVTEAQFPKAASVSKKYSTSITALFMPLVTCTLRLKVWLQFPYRSLKRPYNLWYPTGRAETAAVKA